jgi:hypothetical protein
VFPTLARRTRHLRSRQRQTLTRSLTK